MESEFIPWQPHAETPFVEGPNAASRTQSQLMQMYSLRSVHGSLQRIAHDMEQVNSSLVAFEEADPTSMGPRRGSHQVVAAQTAAEEKLSIQRNSTTPETAHSMANPTASWDQFSVAKRRGVSEVPTVASKGGGNGSLSPAPSHRPQGQLLTMEVASAAAREGQLLQPVRSAPIDPNATDMMTCATSAFVSRQYEALSRKDIIIEELDTRHAMVLLFSQATATLFQREHFLEGRRLRERVALLEEQEAENQLAASEGLREIEANAREHLQRAQLEAMRDMHAEVSRMLTSTGESSARGGVRWATMHEERRRHDLEMEHDRGLAKIMGEHLSQLQRLALEFHLYHARAQNIGGRRDSFGDGTLSDTSCTSIVLSNLGDGADGAPPARGHVYDPYSERSLAAQRGRSSSPAAAAGPSGPLGSAYLEGLLGRRAAGADTSKAPPSVGRSRHSNASNNNSSNTNKKREVPKVRLPRRPLPPPSDAPHQGEAASATKNERVEMLRQKKAAAAAAQPPSSGKGAHPKLSSPDAPSSSQSPLIGSSSSLRGKARRDPQQIIEDAERDQAGPSLLAGVPVFDNADEEEARRKAGIAREQLTSLGQFDPVWGWMLKSTGVLMSWQRRFFVMTKSGKIKYTSQDPTKEEAVRWVHLLNAEDITRVESDTFADTAVRPPTNQFNVNCFYVDAVRSHRHPGDGGAPRTERFKFCCGNKAELNKWMWALRGATDTVYTLEEGGLVERSPLREHFRRMYAILSPLLNSSIQAARQGQLPAGAEVGLPTYRRRIQMEDDIAALEAQQREAYARERQREEDEQRKFILSPRTARSPSPPASMLV